MEKEKNRILEDEKEKLIKLAELATRIIEERDGLIAGRVLSKHKIDELLSKNEEITRICLKDVQKMVYELRGYGNNLDICFCIDATGSMSRLINGVKNWIINVSQKIASSTGMSCRFALVVYRDYCDDSTRHQVMNFTDSSNLSNYLSTVTPTTGGNRPENCFGRLYAACTRVSWSAPSRIIVWMGGSPQHGRQYVDGGDYYPGGDPDGITSSKIFKKLLSNKINLVFCRLTAYTDKMMAQLRTEIVPYRENLLLEYNLEGDNIAEFLVKTVTATTSRTLAFGLRGGREKTYSITPATWDVGSALWRPEEPCKIYTFRTYTGHGTDIHPLIDLLLDGPDTIERNAKINVTVQPVEKGEMRLAFYSKITEDSSWYSRKRETKKGIVKESRFEGDCNRRKYLINQAKIQTTSIFLASAFNQKIEELKIRAKKLCM